MPIRVFSLPARSQSSEEEQDILPTMSVVLIPAV